MGGIRIFTVPSGPLLEVILYISLTMDITFPTKGEHASLALAVRITLALVQGESYP